MCTKDRNVYIKFVRVSNNLYYYARYLLRLWCSRMRHGGMVSRGRWDMRWWWFSLTDILIHIIHVIHTYVHTLRWGGDTPAAPTLFRFFLTYTYICSYTYICTYTHIYIYTHTWTYISPWPCTLRWGEIPQLHRLHTTLHNWVRERYPAAPTAHFFWTLHTQVRGRYPSCTLTCISIPALRQGEWVGLFVLFIGQGY